MRSLEEIIYLLKKRRRFYKVSDFDHSIELCTGLMVDNLLSALLMEPADDLFHCINPGNPWYYTFVILYNDALDRNQLMDCYGELWAINKKEIHFPENKY